MKVYHYSSVRDWEDIQRAGAWGGSKEPGLIPLHSLGRENENARKTFAIFALLEAVPKDWTHNTKFPDVWSNLKRKTGNMLLEIEVDDADPNAFVVDWGEMEAFLNTPKDAKEISREVAEGRYIGSRVPLNEYLKDPSKYLFILPEVIITQPVPLARISISAEQPFLFESINSWPKGSKYQQREIRDITAIPELKRWYENVYLPTKEKSGPLSEFKRKLK